MIKAKGHPAKKPLSYSLNGKRMRKKYRKATGDDIESQPFWPGYEQLVEDRNKAVHAGHEVDRDSAQKGIDAAKAFVQHVAQHNGLA